MNGSHNDFRLKAYVVSLVKNRKLYRAGLDDATVDAMATFSSAKEFAAIMDEEMSGEPLTRSEGEMGRFSPKQNLVRWMLRTALEAALGSEPPEPLLRDGYFNEIVEHIRARHADPRPTPTRESRPAPIQGVYFIRAEGTPFVKIGISQGSKARLSNMQTGCPMSLNLLATMPGGRDVEASLHERFSHLNERGEWFRLEPELAAFIDRLVEGGEAI